VEEELIERKNIKKEYKEIRRREKHRTQTKNAKKKQN
jgi:hypothetical protein